MDDEATPGVFSDRARLAELGEYFALPRRVPGHGQELSTLLHPATVLDFVDRTRVAIAASAGCDTDDIPVRLAASSFQLGVVARLLSPVMGAATCFSAVPVITAHSVAWEPDAHAPRFAMADLEWVGAESVTVAATAIAASVLTTILGPLNAVLRSAAALSSHVTWGNVISAANGAVTVVAMSRPQYESRGRALVEALMDTENLRETGHFVRGRFLRRSCCLFYRSPGSGLCDDCVLDVATLLQRTPR